MWSLNMKKTIFSVILILILYGISYAEVNKDEKSRVDIKKFLEENSISSQERVLLYMVY